MTHHPGAFDGLDALDWSGTSDGAAALRARAAMTVEQRLAWLEEVLDLALATGALAADRARRQAAADAWAQPTQPMGRSTRNSV
jgi:hypothetical protein